MIYHGISKKPICIPNPQSLSLQDLYDFEYMKFAHHEHGLANMAFASVIHDILNPASVIDFGCGSCDYLLYMYNCGINILGIDCSPGSIKLAELLDPELKNGIVIHDLRIPIQVVMSYLTTCIEVIEHIEPEYSDILIKSLCDSSDTIIFTSCPPTNKNNPRHPSEYPHQYWLDKFVTHNFQVDENITSEIKIKMKQISGLNLFTVPSWLYGNDLSCIRRNK